MTALYIIRPLSEENAREIATWRYDQPYNLYDLSQENIQGLLDPEFRYHQVLDSGGKLIGYCCYGLDARVPGGEYRLVEPEVLDLGVGLKPSLTGKGLGVLFVQSVLDYGALTYQPQLFRATIAGFNQRSLRTFQNLGFKIQNSFIRELADTEFFQLDRLVKEDEDG